MHLKNSPGIYSIYIPSIDSWYIGSSVDIAKRYKQHLYGSHSKLLVKYKNELIFTVIIYLEPKTVAEIRKIEQSYIDDYKARGLNLINKSAPNTSSRQVNSKSICQYDLKGKLLNTYFSIENAMFDLNLTRYRLLRMLAGKSNGPKNTVLIYYKDRDKIKSVIKQEKEIRKELKELRKLEKTK